MGNRSFGLTSVLKPKVVTKARAVPLSHGLFLRPRIAPKLLRWPEIALHYFQPAAGSPRGASAGTLVRPFACPMSIHFARSLRTRTSRQGPRQKFEGFPDCWDPGGYRHFHSTHHRRHSGSLENSPPLRGAIYGAVCQLRKGRYRVGGLSYDLQALRCGLGQQILRMLFAGSAGDCR